MEVRPKFFFFGCVSMQICLATWWLMSAVSYLREHQYRDRDGRCSRLCYSSVSRSTVEELMSLLTLTWLDAARSVRVNHRTLSLHSPPTPPVPRLMFMAQAFIAFDPTVMDGVSAGWD